MLPSLATRVSAFGCGFHGWVSFVRVAWLITFARLLLAATGVAGLNPPLLQAVEPRAPQLLFTLSNTAPLGGSAAELFVSINRPLISKSRLSIRWQLAAVSFFDLHAQGRVALEIQRSNVLINSDRVIEASTTLDGTHVQLILTFSGTSLFGRLKAGDDVFQLQAALGARDYEGWFYRPSVCRASSCRMTQYSSAPVYRDANKATSAVAEWA